MSGLGAFGETIAAAHLSRQGYQILSRNLRLPPWGEIDIVARRDGVTVLVEVRTRRGERGRFGPALASLSPAKQARMVRAAEAYLAVAKVEAVRIDLIAVTLDATGRVVDVAHVENAVQP